MRDGLHTGQKADLFSTPPVSRSRTCKLPNTDEKLTALDRRRDNVKGKMSAAWDNPSPDMGALEALHYELQNLEYQIATREREDES